MLISSYHERLDCLKAVVQRFVDETGAGSLSFAALGGSINVCRYLIEELDIDVNVKDLNGLTPICYGAMKGHFSTVEYLLEKGANPGGSNDPNTNTPLHYDVLGGEEKIQTLLLSKGIRIDVATKSGTALSYAVALGHFDAVKVLLDHHADPNAVLHGCVPPLTTAILNKSLQIMDLLLQAGADPNVKAGGRTPLLYAASYGLAAAVPLLLEAGADPNASDDEGMTAVECAAIDRNREIVKILFPATKCIPTYPIWSVNGLMEHVHSEAARKKKRTLEGLDKFHQGKTDGTETCEEKKLVRAAPSYSQFHLLYEDEENEEGDEKEDDEEGASEIEDEELDELEKVNQYVARDAEEVDAGRQFHIMPSTALLEDYWHLVSPHLEWEHIV